MRLSVLLLLCATAALPEVRSVRVAERSDVAGARPFGNAGPYERLVGKVNFAVDPAATANRIIVNIDRAPRNGEGLVEFSADLYILKPTDPSRGNGTILFEVSNRGNKGLIGTFNNASSTRDPRADKEFGDAFLLERGFTLVWLGWQFDVPDEADALRAYLPVATSGGTAIAGLVRSEFVPSGKTTEMNLGDRNMIGYAVADPNDSAIQLTVRDRCDSARRPISRQAFAFARLEGGKPVDDPSHIYMASGFEPGKIYELVYRARDPVVAGLGAAGIRDFISFLKFGTPNAGIMPLGDQPRFLKRAIGFGTSQCGRFLRTFLYFGFNADEQARKVFDGVWAHVAGGGRGFFNHQFAQPSRDGHPHMNCFYPVDIFPFTDSPQTDSETGLTDSLLGRVEDVRVVPKIFYTNGSYEYWGRNAALIHSSLDGKKDEPLAPGTRAYYFAGTQHGPGSFPPQRSGYVNPSNVNDFRPVMRALLAAMNDWLAAGKEPPPSLTPLVAKDQLVTRGALRFPSIPGVTVPARPKQAWRVDYGSEFREKGIIAHEPPKTGSAFAVLLPQVDADGNETSGVRLPCLMAPLGTYTGWNLRAKETGAPEEIYSMTGSYLPFAATKAARQKSGDPRPSIEERYANRSDYLGKFRAAANALAAAGYILERDIEQMTGRASRQWDAIMDGR